MVMDISLAEGSSDKIVTAMNRTDGLFHINAKTVILAMGCRERSRGAFKYPGLPSRRHLLCRNRAAPGEHRRLYAGTQGCGSSAPETSAFIMARRMTLEGAEVKVVAELMPYSGGLKRNIVQCLDDFGIPLKAEPYCR